MAKKKVLDEGFLSTVTAGANMKMQIAQEWVLIDIDKIDPNPYQPRFDVGDITELAQSIKKNGLQQPIKVSIAPNGRYTLLYGHRRLASEKLNSTKKIRALVCEADNKKLFDVAMIENFHRKDISGLEYALKFQEILKEGLYKTQQELCEALAISKSKMSKIMSLLNLDKEIQEDIKNSDKVFGYSTLSEIAKLNKMEQKNAYENLKVGIVKRDDIKKSVSKITTSQMKTKHAKIQSLKCNFDGKMITLAADADFPLKKEFEEIVEKFNQKGKES